MTSRIKKAVELRNDKGYNCAQAVLCAYADMFGLDESAAYKIAEGFGHGRHGRYVRGRNGSLYADRIEKRFRSARGQIDQSRDLSANPGIFGRF